MRKTDHQFERLLKRLRATGEPIRTDDLVRSWADKNYNALVHAAFLVMRDQLAKSYSIPPLTITGFATEAERDAYHAQLCELVRGRGEAVTFQAVACLHVEKFVIWSRRLVEDLLAGIAIEAKCHEAVFADTRRAP